MEKMTTVCMGDTFARMMEISLSVKEMFVNPIIKCIYIYIYIYCIKRIKFIKHIFFKKLTNKHKSMNINKIK